MCVGGGGGLEGGGGRLGVRCPCPPVCAGIGCVSGPVIEMTYDPRFSKKKSVNVIQSSPLDTRFPRKPTFVRNNVFKA